MLPKQHPPHLITRRLRRRRKNKRSPAAFLRCSGWVLALVISLALAGAAIWGAVQYSQLSDGLPAVDGLPLLLDSPDGYLLQPTRFYDRSGEQLIFEFHNPNSAEARYLTLAEVPQHVLDALLATNDPAFWQHGGFIFSLDPQPQTLAERLADEILLWGESTSTENTLRRRLLAAQITDTFGREKVLEWTINHADFGQLAYGVDQAAWVYFGKPAQELSIAEAALLAASAATPALNPIDAPEIALERQGEVLSAMLSQGYLTEEQALNANAQPIQIQPPADITAGLAPDFFDYALDQLSAEISPARLARGGLVVITTLDAELQAQAACTAQTQLDRLQGLIGPEAILDQDCDSARLLPSLTRAQTQASPGIEAAAVVIEPASGQVLALVGDADQPHTPGTILTPFIYLTAFTRGLSPATLVWDIPANLPPSLEGYASQEEDFQGPMRIRTALANDYLMPALQTLTQIGPANVWRTAQQSGLHSLTIPYTDDAYRLILDRGELPLIEVAHAYSLLGNNGTLAGRALDASGQLHPTAILQVLDPEGRTVLDWSQPQAQPVVSSQLAYLLVDILRDDLARQETLGHPNPLESGRPTAAKIGQTAISDQTWTVGFSPQRLTAVWIGTPLEAQPVSPLAAAGLWHALTKTAHDGLPLETWQRPPGISQITVCDPSGLLPTADCPNLVNDLFLSGTEPLQEDNLYRRFFINSQTGRLATVYTPAEYVQEEVFLVVPPEAAEWARNAGLEVPPDSYDVVFSPTNSGPALISAPEIFAYISGQVEIRGTAAGEDFSFFRVQIGEGLNPRQWLQIGQDSAAPVEDGLLASWDTGELNGLYAIQLVVVKSNQEIQTAVIQVTVDNQPPQVQVTLPAEGQRFTYPQESDLTIQVQVTDNLGVANVEIYVDGELLSSLSDPPYATPYSGRVGTHTVTVIATDLAGNTTQVDVEFEIGR